MTRRLDIGPGEERLPGQWTTVDCCERPGVVDKVCQWGAEPLPFPDNTFDLVHASHVLEHIPWHQTIDALKDARRVLRQGGVLELHVPDFDTLMRAAESRCCLDDHAEGGLNQEMHWMHWVAERLFHFGSEQQWHRACFNKEHLTWCLSKAGFQDMKQIDVERGLSHGVINLGMQAIKPGPQQPVIVDEDRSIGGVQAETKDALHAPGVAKGLPYCHSRRDHDSDNGVYFCAHPRVHTPANLVRANICRLCTRDQEPPPQTFRSYPSSFGVTREGPCWYLGELMGLRQCPSCRGKVRVKVFDCDHADHESTTIRDCIRCADYERRLQRGGVQQWAVGVTTAPRRQATLGRCLESVVTAGWTDLRLSAEPGAPIPDFFEHLPCTQRSDRLGAWSNWFLTLEELYQRESKADVFMIVQDDVVFSRNTRAYLERVLWPCDRLGVVSLYHPGRRVDETGFVRLDCEDGLPGALALLFPNAAARLLLGDREAILHRRRGPTVATRHIDVVVGQWAHRLGLPAYCHRPSLVQHIGQTTTVWGESENSVIRQATDFLGEEVDALSLLDAERTADSAGVTHSTNLGETGVVLG